MAYKLSDRLKQNDHHQNHWDDDDAIDFGKLAGVFFGFGILSLFTAWIFTIEPFLFSDQQYSLSSPQKALEVGPIHVRKFNEVYSVSFDANLPVQSWSFIQGEVLDSNKQYLFAFGKELWHERGRDSDGTWQESDDSFTLKITFPKPGRYYLKFGTESNRMPSSVRIRVAKRLGSSIPHLWFGIVLILIGIVLNEIKNKTLGKWWERAQEAGN